MGGAVPVTTDRADMLGGNQFVLWKSSFPTLSDYLCDLVSVLGCLWCLLGFQCCGGPGSTAEAENRKAGVPECTEPGRLLN